MKKKVALIGANGFVGRYIHDLVAKNGILNVGKAQHLLTTNLKSTEEFIVESIESFENIIHFKNRINNGTKKD